MVKAAVVEVAGELHNKVSSPIKNILTLGVLAQGLIFLVMRESIQSKKTYHAIRKLLSRCGTVPIFTGTVAQGWLTKMGLSLLPYIAQSARSLTQKFLQPRRCHLGCQMFKYLC
jgi:hypothetical protein